MVLRALIPPLFVAVHVFLGCFVFSEHDNIGFVSYFLSILPYWRWYHKGACKRPFTNQYTKNPSEPHHLWWVADEAKKGLHHVQHCFVSLQTFYVTDWDSVLSKGRGGFNLWIYSTMKQTGRAPADFKTGVNGEWLCCLDRWVVYRLPPETLQWRETVSPTNNCLQFGWSEAVPFTWLCESAVLLTLWLDFYYGSGGCGCHWMLY